jgi:hypothetical protein
VLVRRHRLLSSVALSACALFGCAMPEEPPGELVGAYHVDGALTENTCGSDALPAADPLSFDVQIRKDKNGGGLWLQGSPPARPGKLDEDGAFSFQAESTYDAKQMNGAEPIESVYEQDPEQLADPDLVEKLQMQAMRSCRLVITETIDGQMLRMAKPAGEKPLDVSASDAGGPIEVADDDDVGDDGDAKPVRGDDDGDDLVGVNEITIRAQTGSDCGIVLSAMGGPFLALPCSAHYDLTGTLASE